MPAGAIFLHQIGLPRARPFRINRLAVGFRQEMFLGRDVLRERVRDRYSILSAETGGEELVE
jgi:hypothetical protein